MPIKWTPGRNGQTLRKVQSLKTEPGRNRKYEQINNKQIHANKMDNLEEMDKFLERYNLSRLNQEEIENMNKSTTSNEIDTVI